MTLTQTMNFQDKPIGEICQDQFTGCVTFVPNYGHERLAMRKWANVSACKKSALRAYRKEEKKACLEVAQVFSRRIHETNR